MAAATSEAGIDTSLFFLAYSGARTKSAKDREPLGVVDSRKVTKALAYMMTNEKTKDFRLTCPIQKPWAFKL